jgi:hypothetical protein
MKHSFALLVGFILLVPLPGCSPSLRFGSVTGVLTLENTPFPNATITFVSANGNAVAAASDENGRYSVENVPVGPTMIGIISVADGEQVGKSIKERGEARGADLEKLLAAEAKAKKNLKAIPTRYNDPAGSKLVFEVQEGPNSYDIKITK